MTENDETYSYIGTLQDVRSSLREIDVLRESLAHLDAKRVMVICGQNVLHKSDVVSRVEEALGDLVVGRFDGVETHAPVEVAEAANDLAKSFEPDTLITVGGGSATTIAKGVALLQATNRPLEDFRTQFIPPNTVIPPAAPLPDVKTQIVSVTTTLGFAETGRGGGGFASRARTEKLSIAGDGRTTPRLIVIDGLALATTPDAILKGTAIGQLRIAIEGVTSNAHNPLGEALGLHAIRLLEREFALGWSSDPHQLLRMKAACYLASKAMDAVGPLGINTAIAHHVGAVSNVAHGEANAVLLPHTIRFNASDGADRYRLVAAALGIEKVDSPVGFAGAIIDRIETICESLGIARRLRDIGVNKDELSTIAQATLGDRSMAASPRPVRSADEVLEILEAAY